METSKSYFQCTQNRKPLFIDLLIFYKTQTYCDAAIFQVSWDRYKCALYKQSCTIMELIKIYFNLGTILWYGTGPIYL